MVHTIYETWQRYDDQITAIGGGGFETREEAERHIADFRECQTRNYRPADEYWVKEVAVTNPFVIPPKPRPRELYAAQVSRVETPGKNTWDYLDVAVHYRDDTVPIAHYRRNYPAFNRTFEPFRQLADPDRHYALISRHYTATAVLDLQSSTIVAEEKPASNGFCPVGFYVPDWWDVHDGSILPGSHFWNTERDETPRGDYGFVWGCVWGDDTSWKVQHLDLSDVAKGEIGRDDRYGYVELATISDDPTDFIRVHERSIRFATWQDFKFTGERLSWQ